MKRILIILSLLVVLISFLSAQETKGQPEKKATEVQKEQKIGTDEKKELEKDEKTMEQSGSTLYVYDPRGRRDPFVDLLKGASAKGKREFKEGVAGLNIDELELEGIIRKGNVPYAQLKGPDNKSYLVKAGVEVYDGRLTRINPKSVVFVKTYQIGSSTGENKTKIIKRLNPEEEESGK